jgi:hypothetical protein
MYFDGVEDTSLNIVTNTLAATIASSFAFQLGDRTLSDLPYAGKLDEVSVYDVELTAGQVADLYAFGAPVDITALGSWSDAQGYWRMGEASFDGTMTNMESTDIVEGDGPGWEWSSIFRGGYQSGFTQIFRPQQFPVLGQGRYVALQAPFEADLSLCDVPALRSPFGGSRDQNPSVPLPPDPGSTITHYFRMRGVDDGTGAYTTWTALDAPDPDGSQATAGNTTPTLVGSIVAGSGVTLHDWRQES